MFEKYYDIDQNLSGGDPKKLQDYEAVYKEI